MNIVYLSTLEYSQSLTVPFDITFEINDTLQGIQSIRNVSSMISWLKLKDILAQMFNIHQSSLHAQYRLSTDAKGSLPFELSDEDSLRVMVDMVHRVVMPNQLANGKTSRRQRKAPTIQVTNKSAQHTSSTNKVRYSG